jgi:serine/threonine protein kinase
MKNEKHLELFVERHCLKKLADVSGVVKILDHFQDEINLYISLEFLDGKELWHLCNVWGFKSKQKVHYYFY